MNSQDFSNDPGGSRTRDLRIKSRKSEAVEQRLSSPPLENEAVPLRDDPAIPGDSITNPVTNRTRREVSPL